MYDHGVLLLLNYYYGCHPPSCVFEKESPRIRNKGFIDIKVMIVLLPHLVFGHSSAVSKYLLVLILLLAVVVTCYKLLLTSVILW